MTINISETLVSGYKPLKNKGHSVTLTIKQEDISEDDAKILQNLWTDGGSLVAVFQTFDTEPVKQVKSTQHLAVVMGKYCDAHGIDIEEQKKVLYKKYNVTSRAEMKEEDILVEIESYNLGLYN